jgi:hypothetical protein
MAEKRTTRDAVAILHERYVKDDARRKASLAQERVNVQVARLTHDMRTDAGLTQAELAKLVGTTQSVNRPSGRFRLRGAFAIDAQPNR